MKIYTKSNHIILAIDMGAETARDSIRQLAYALRCYAPLNHAARKVEFLAQQILDGFTPTEDGAAIVPPGSEGK